MPQLRDWRRIDGVSQRADASIRRSRRFIRRIDGVSRPAVTHFYNGGVTMGSKDVNEGHEYQQIEGEFP